MQLNAKYKFPRIDGSGGKFWYTVAFNGRLFRHTNLYENFKEITPTNEKIDVSHFVVENRFKFSWTCIPCNIIYVNRTTDNWYDLVYHFMYGYGFSEMYINDKKDVVIKIHVEKYNTTIYYGIKYMSWFIEYIDLMLICVKQAYCDVSNDGFYYIGNQNAKFENTNKQEIVSELLKGHRVVLDKDTYKTVKMVRDIIEDQTQPIFVDKMHDIKVVCAE